MRHKIYTAEEARARKRNQTAKSIARLTAYTFKYSPEKDAAIIAKLASVENKADYVRQLILADIAKGE